MNVDTHVKFWHENLTQDVVRSRWNKLSQQGRLCERERRQRWAWRLRGVFAALSAPLHSVDLSDSSLSQLTSLLKTGARRQKTGPLPQPPNCHHDPGSPVGSAPPFTRDPAPDPLCLFPRSLWHEHTHQRASLSWGGRWGSLFRYRRGGGKSSRVKRIKQTLI